MEINTETAKLIQREKSLSYLDGIINGLEFANSCKDAISRKEVLEKFGKVLGTHGRQELMKMKTVLPTYQQGKWIDFGLADKYGTHEYKCTNCNNSVYDKEDNIKYHKYCLHCGSRNEVEE